MGKRKDSHRRRSTSSEGEDEEEGNSCPCGKATGSSYWILCDGCEIWYHGKCAKFTEKETSMVDKFYCDKCVSKNSLLRTTYKPGFHPKRSQHRELDHREEVSLNEPIRKLADVQPQVIRETPKPIETQRVEDFRKLAEKQTALLQAKAKATGRCDNCSACFRTANCDVCKNCYSDKMCIRRICIHRTEDQGALPRSEDEKAREKLKEAVKKMDEQGLFYGKERVTVKLSNNDDVRQCDGPKCTKQSRPGSKYCSHECGLNRARLRLLVILPFRVKDYIKEPPDTFHRLQASIDASVKEQKRLEDELVTLTNTRAYFAAYIKNLEELDKTTTRDTASPAQDPKKAFLENDDNTGTGFSGRCPICGQLSGSYGNLQKHIMKCYFRIEKRTCFVGPYPQTQNPEDIICDVYCKPQSAYCKRLKVLCFDHYKGFLTAKETICGAPLGIYEECDSISLKGPLGLTDIMSKGYCNVAKDQCDKHHNWGIALLGSLDNYRLALIRRTEQIKFRLQQYRSQYNRRYDVSTLLTNFRVNEDTDRYGMPKDTDVTKKYPEYIDQQVEWTESVREINQRLQMKLNERFAEAEKKKAAEKAKVEALKKAKAKNKRLPMKKKGGIVAAKRAKTDTPRRSISKDTSMTPAPNFPPTSDTHLPPSQSPEEVSLGNLLSGI